MNLVCLVLGDNDFGNTFVPLLKTIHKIIQEDPSVSREHIYKLVHLGIAFHYYAYQGSSINNVGVLDYLSKIEILFDGEAAKFIESHDHDGGSWFLEVSCQITACLLHTLIRYSSGAGARE